MTQCKTESVESVRKNITRLYLKCIEVAIMKFVITGASGFIGRNFSERLFRYGHEVVLVLRPGHDMRHLKKYEQIILLPMDRYEELGELAGP